MRYWKSTPHTLVARLGPGNLGGRFRSGRDGYGRLIVRDLLYSCRFSIKTSFQMTEMDIFHRE